MWTPLRVPAIFGVSLVTACSSATHSIGGVGASASAGGRGGAANATGGGGASQTGGGGSANGTGMSFCVIGYRGCVCDAGSRCALGLTCTSGTCCDAVTGDCSVPSTGAGTGSGHGAASNGNGGASNGNGGASNGNGGANNGNGGTGTCAPGVVGPVITDCGYPYTSGNPLTSVAFNESEVLRGILPSGGAPLASIRLFYNDEHALTLGVRSVTVTMASGDTTTEYPVTPLVNDPDHASYPQTGTNSTSGDQSGLDPSGRPMWPALFVTDITGNPNDRSGDWQQGGRPYNPNVIFGSWKAAVRTVDTTVTPSLVSITPDADPAKNGWNLGGGDPVPAGFTKNEGYGAEVRWDLVLIPGHSYRLQVMVHDGDQNKVGGDSGEACVNFCAGASCPDGSSPCDSDAVCPSGMGAVCVQGCCLLPG